MYIYIFIENKRELVFYDMYLFFISTNTIICCTIYFYNNI